MAENVPLVEVRHVSKYFPRGRKRLRAVNDVSFSIKHGEVLGLVGESGSGKSTLGRVIVRLVDPDDGEVLFKGKDITRLGSQALRPLRKQMQMIFQDPYGSLTPHMTVSRIVEDPLIVHKIGTKTERQRRVEELLDLVGMPPNLVDAHPYEISGGQQQRVAIARAIALNPDFIVCDEPVSSLDVSIQAQVLTLLRDLKARLKMSYLFIAHNLAAVEYMADRVIVMYLGEVLETGDAESIFTEPLHPYTQALIAAVPKVATENGGAEGMNTLTGEIPSAIDPPAGCVFNTRCPIAKDKCRQAKPEGRAVGKGRVVACHYA